MTHFTMTAASSSVLSYVQISWSLLKVEIVCEYNAKLSILTLAEIDEIFRYAILISGSKYEVV